MALNAQGNDRPMWFNQGKFLGNGGCGYILKPEYMQSRQDNELSNARIGFDKFNSDDHAVVVKIKVISATVRIILHVSFCHPRESFIETVSHIYCILPSLNHCRVGLADGAWKSFQTFSARWSWPEPGRIVRCTFRLPFGQHVDV
eukprot:COSAG01_NODE_633_length_14669_cov_7.174056_10_plen_145_part_00